MLLLPSYFCLRPWPIAFLGDGVLYFDLVLDLVPEMVNFALTLEIILVAQHSTEVDLLSSDREPLIALRAQVIIECVILDLDIIAHSQQLFPVCMLDPQWLINHIFVKDDQELALGEPLRNTP